MKIMGVINVTPDSFSDGGLFYNIERAVQLGIEMARDGADIIDIGGESTRPGAEPVSLEEELHRVVPVIEKLANTVDIPISIDTYKSKVAEEAVAAGATIVNDISGLTFDPKMAKTAARLGTTVIIMHIKGTPRDMQKNPHYDDLLGEIIGFLKKQVCYATESGIEQDKIWVDPGIGFGKKWEDNLPLLHNLRLIKEQVGKPVLIGASRKSFLGEIASEPHPEKRDFATTAVNIWAYLQGADVIRVHNVRATRDAILVWRALETERLHPEER